MDSIIRIDRSKPFDVQRLYKNMEDYSLEEEDLRSIALVEIDLSKVKLVLSLQTGEVNIPRATHIERLKRMNVIRLDVQVREFLYRNQELIPESWRGEGARIGNTIDFDGTVYKCPDDRMYFSLSWHTHGGTNKWMRGDASGGLFVAKKRSNDYGQHFSAVLAV